MTISTQTFSLTAALVCLALAPAHTNAAVDFKTDIEPIFESSCLKCHGPQKQKGDLRLDSKAAALKGGKDGVVIEPGHADKSDLYRRITLPDGADDVMPSKGDLLSKKQTDLIRDWINEGANWPEGEIAKVAEPAAEPSGVATLPPFKPSPQELAAVAKFESAGIMIRPIAANVSWREATFRARGTNVTDATIAPLKDILGLVDLNLSGTKVTDAGLQSIAGLTNLISLHLDRTQVTDSGMAHLKNLTHLVYLNLYGTSVTDAGLQSLKGIATLRHLYLWQTKVTAQGADDLKKALPKLEISRGWENDPAAIAAKKKEEEKAKAEKAKMDEKAKADAKTEAKK